MYTLIKALKHLVLGATCVDCGRKHRRFNSRSIVPYVFCSVECYDNCMQAEAAMLEVDI